MISTAKEILALDEKVLSFIKEQKVVNVRDISSLIKDDVGKARSVLTRLQRKGFLSVTKQPTIITCFDNRKKFHKMCVYSLKENQ